jgi:hypothetical protein
MSESVWKQKGGTLSDKSARKEFGLSQEEIIEGINGGKLEYRINYMHGNPYFKLVRSEVEALAEEKYGRDYLVKKKLENELAQVNRELKRLKAESVILERRKMELLDSISN